MKEGQPSLDFGPPQDARREDELESSGPAGIPGLKYMPNVLTLGQQQRTLEAIDAAPWMSTLERKVQHYGWRYDYRSRVVTADMRIGALPAWLEDLAKRLHRETDTFDRIPDQAIVNEYLPGQGIAMHIDRQCFGDTVATVSLGDCWQMDLRPLGADRSRTLRVSLAPGSALILSGEARYRWLHGIAKRKRDRLRCGSWRPRERRVSVTFRTVLP